MMRGRLLESRRERERARTGVAASVGVHAVVVGAAVWLTAGPAKPARADAVGVVALAMPPAPAAPVPPTAPSHASGAGRRGSVPVIPPDLALPGMDPGSSIAEPSTAVDWSGLVASSSDIGVSGAASTEGGRGDGGGVWTTADEPPVPAGLQSVIP